MIYLFHRLEVEHVEYTVTFEIQDIEGKDALFYQRETGFYRIPYELEKKVLMFIVKGQPKEMIAFCKSLLLTPDFKLPIGKTSHNQLRLLKYSAVAAISLACRGAIEGGAVEAVAYSKSDDDILIIDNKNTPAEVLLEMANSLIGFAEMVKQHQAKSTYSPVVRGCIEYITVHSHHNITLDELANGTDYSKEYLARLFRKEVGIPVSDYILKCKIEEAETLLKNGNSCSETANILGFSSQSYFIRQFKKATRITPSKFVERINKVKR